MRQDDDSLVRPWAAGDAPQGADIAALWQWRRTIGDLYAAVRAMEAREGWQHWRQARDRLFEEHSQSPLDPPRRFSALEVFPYDPALRFAVELRPAPTGRTRDIFVGNDGWVQVTAFATTRGLEVPLGGELTLYWLQGYGGGVWLPFQDATSGRETYGGGRYLLDTIKGADLGWDGRGRAVLDFNFAYNPSCAYSSRWVCPLAPPENRLPARIAVGEKAFVKPE